MREYEVQVMRFKRGLFIAYRHKAECDRSSSGRSSI